MRRLLTALAAPILALALLAAPAGAAASGASKDPSRAANQNRAVSLVSDMTSYTWKEGRAELRQFSHHRTRMTDITGWRAPGLAFTISYGADQACLRWARTTSKSAKLTTGPCVRAHSTATRTPLLTSVRFLARLAKQAALPGDRGGIWGLLAVDSMRESIHFATPDGVIVTSVTDRDHDNLEDDGRLAFTKNGRIVCLELPLTRDHTAKIYHTSCDRLPARDMQPARDLLYNW